MSSDQETPTEGGHADTARQRPLGREFALAATLHGAFGLGEEPEPTIARYRIERRLGVGGMSEVFLAQDPELRRQVAIKVLNHHFAAKEQQRLMREGWALASVPHPAIVAVHDVGVADGRAFLVMEHVEGRTLDAWLAARRRSLVEILRLMVPVCEGLAQAHDRGVIHRDLKPRNLLVSDRDRAKVIDFGLVVAGDPDPSRGSDRGSDRGSAREADRDAAGDVDPEEAPSRGPPLVPGPGALTRDGALAGTPAYMSPEQASEQRELDGRSDVFSLAIVIYEAVFGGRPFEGKGLAVLDAIVVAPPRRPRRRGARARLLWGVLQRALAKDPRARYQTMRELGAALQQVIDRPRRIAIAVGIAAMVIAAVIAGTTVPQALRVRACEQQDAPWTEIAALEDGPLRARLDGFRGEWGAAWRRGCAMAHRDGALSVDVGLPLRQTCLVEVKELVVDALGRAQRGDPAERRPLEDQLLLAELPSIAACEASVTARNRRPHNPSEEGAIRAVEASRREAETLFLIGSIPEAEAKARHAVDLAIPITHRWTRARARLTLGRILRRVESTDAEAIVRTLSTAANEAIADRDRVLGIQALQEAARGAVLLAHDLGRSRDLIARARAELLGLDALAEPLGTLLRASEADIDGLIAYEAGAPAEAEAGHRAAIQRLRGVASLDDEGRSLLAAAWLNLGRTLDEDDPEARAAFDEAYAIRSGSTGDDHPSLAVIRHSQAYTAHAADHPKIARQLAEEALALAERAGSGATTQTAATEVLLAVILQQSHEYALAERHARAAAAKYEALTGGHGVDLLEARTLIAASLHAQGQREEAKRADQVLVDQCLADDTLDDDDRADTLLYLAKARIDEKSPEEALLLLDTLERRLGAEKVSPSALAVRGWALHDANRDAEAIISLEKGISGLDSGNKRAERARSEWVLVMALIAERGDQRRICELLESCREHYAAPGQSPEVLASLDELRAAQGCSSTRPRKAPE